MKADINAWVEVKQNGWTNSSEIFELIDKLTEGLKENIDNAVSEIEQLEKENDDLKELIEDKDYKLEEKQKHIEKLEGILDDISIVY